MAKENLEKITHFSPAYDKRDPDPSKDYGIGCVKAMMVLKGKRGAVHFVFGTGMLLGKTMKEYIKDGRGMPELMGSSYFSINKPMGYDVGQHTLKPIYDGQRVSQESCEWLDGKPCYCDGSALAAEEYLKVLISEGSDKIWEMLEERYYELPEVE